MEGGSTARANLLATRRPKERAWAPAANDRGRALRPAATRGEANIQAALRGACSIAAVKLRCKRRALVSQSGTAAVAATAAGSYTFARAPSIAAASAGMS